MSATEVSNPPPLFPKPVPIIGGTGPHESGKTVFGLTICPGPQTLYYDFEQSGASYGELGHHRVNVVEEMRAKHPNGYKPTDLFFWWQAHVKAIPPGKYRVIVLDPATDIERGMTDWVNANPRFFGHTEGQYQKMSGIMWGDVRDYWKSILGDLSSRCETLYYTAHLGKVFEDNKATGKDKIKGKSTLSELASLFLWFERKADARGVKPNKPAAHVVKSRLMVMKVGADGEIEMQQVLPPRMAVATPNELRRAFAIPAGGREIDELERHVEERLSDDDRLRMELAKAEAERDTVQARATHVGGENESTGPPPPVSEAVAELEASADVPTLVATAKKFAAMGYGPADREQLNVAYFAQLAKIKAAKPAATPAA